MEPDTYLSRITPNFSYQEMTKSLTAKRRGIDNTPSVQSYINLTKLCKFILQPIREMWGEPIIVSSGYRCPEVNKIVGGVKASDHIYGCAADIKSVADTPAKNKLLYDLIRRMYNNGELPDLKQCIDEYGYDWIHISFQDGRSKKLGQFIHITAP